MVSDLKKQRKYIGFLLIAIICIGSIVLMVKKNNENKAIQKQLILQAQQENEKVKEKLAIDEEKRKEDELKNSEEQKKLEEQKKIQDKAKHEEAVKGIGTSKKIPVLMYHSIDYERGNELRIPKEKFREQMKYLKDNGYNPLSLEEVYSHITFGTDIPDKPVVISFDDGYVDNYTNAYPVLKEFGFKAVIFPITNVIDTSATYLTSKQIKEMSDNGISIGSHTVSHTELNKLTYDKQVKELKESKEFLEKILGKEVKAVAYPYGKFNNDTLKIVQELGYSMALSTKSGPADKTNGIYKLNRIYISEKYDLEKFKTYLKTN